MSQIIDLAVKGLHTYASDLSGVPQGALTIADDVNISRVNIVESRRGFDFLGYDPSAEVKKLVFYGSGMFAHYGTTFGYGGTTAAPAAWASRGTLSAPTYATSIRTAALNNNLYVTNSTGISKTDAVATSLYAAGVPKGTLIEQNGAITGSGTAVLNTENVAYRYLIARKDANNNTVFGGVSSRFVINNGVGSTGDINLRVYIPSGLDTTYFVQVYRTEGTATAVTPNDELYLCYEHLVVAGDITLGYFDFRDIVPEGLLGASLYTSPSQEGLVNDNAMPPLARDIAEFKNHLFLADVTSKYRFTLSLIGAGSAPGIVNDQTITIGAEVYTGKSSANVASKQFAVATGGTPAQNIDSTARSLVSVINQQSAGGYYAFMQSDGNDGLPGKILIEERTNTGSVFTVSSSNGVCWSPILSTAVSATNDDYKNGLMFSKQGIPEAVPLKNIIKVGSSDYRIQRILPLRDGLFIFKGDGIYVLRGENESSFAVSLLDGTAKIKAADSLAVCNNLIYGLFDAGVGEVSDSGFTIIGLPIKDKILNLFGSNTADHLNTYAFGISYELDGKYILCVPASTSEAFSSAQYVFDIYGRTFCKWTLSIRSGAVDPTLGKLYLGAAATAKIKVERKTYTYTDFADYGSLCTATAYSTTTLTINNTSTMTAGDLLVQGTNTAYISSVDPTAGTVVIDQEQPWVLNTADIEHLKAIPCRVEWSAEFAGNPAGFKQFYECNLLFKQDFHSSATMYFYGDANPGEYSIGITSASNNGIWGEFTFGEDVWGGDLVKAPIRVGIPREVSRCNQLAVRFETRVAYSEFQLGGLSLVYNETSTRTSR